jgi:hypothetical protein
MGFTFIEPRVVPVAELIGTSFSYIPKRGPISEGVLLILQGLVSLLQNPVNLFEHMNLLEHTQKILEGKNQAMVAVKSLTVPRF